MERFAKFVVHHRKLVLLIAVLLLIPVSYTHLDVYKRQGLGAAAGGDSLPGRRLCVYFAPGGRSTRISVFEYGAAGFYFALSRGGAGRQTAADGRFGAQHPSGT